MKSVADILLENHCQIHTIGPDAKVFEALELLSRTDSGAVLVTEDDKVVGVFSERDHTRKVDLRGRNSKKTKVREVMTTNIVAVTPETSAENCLEIMYHYNIRHLPVISNDGQLVGFVAILDAIRTVLSEKKDIISHLERYVAESWPF